MSARTRRAVTAVAGTAILLLGSAACSDDSAPPTGAAAFELVAAAPEKTVEAGTARVAMTVRSTFGSTDVQVNGDGLVDFDKDRARIGMSLPALLGERTLTVVMLGTTVYVQIPGVGPVGEFYEIDLTDLGVNADAFTQQLGSANVTSALELLRGVSSDVQEAGTETVRGASTRHYKGTIDPAAALENYPGRVPAYLRSTLKDVGPIPFDAYIDDEGRLSKLTQDVSVPASAKTGNEPVTIATTIEMYDYGTKANITAPPKNRVTDGSGLLRQLVGGER